MNILPTKDNAGTWNMQNMLVKLVPFAVFSNNGTVCSEKQL